MKRNLLCFALVVFYCHAFSQINIGSVNYNTFSPNETNCLQALVSNSGPSVTVYAHVTCQNSLGEIIFEATTRHFNLAQGMNTISGLTIGFSRFSYGNSSKALYLKNYGQLASGNYSYCVRITPLNSTEGGDMYCEDFESAGSDFLSLVAPYDKDTLDTKLPVLTWTHSEPFNVLARNEYFKIVVTEVKKDQSPEQSLLSNPSVFTKSFLNTHSIPYPQDAQVLEDGKTYAWQVQKFSNNMIVNKTDVWSFVMKKPKVVSPNKYALLKSTNDGGFYTTLDDRLYFRFDEEYAPGELNYEIRNEKNEKLVPLVKKENQKTHQGILTQGVNRFELPLNDYDLKEGHYTLIVLNRKNQKFYLRFYVQK